jgi:hypothetical protein
MRILVAAESPAIAKSWYAMLVAQHYAIDRNNNQLRPKNAAFVFL